MFKVTVTPTGDTYRVDEERLGVEDGVTKVSTELPEAGMVGGAWKAATGRDLTAEEIERLRSRRPIVFEAFA